MGGSSDQVPSLQELPWSWNGAVGGKTGPLAEPRASSLASSQPLDPLSSSPTAHLLRVPGLWPLTVTSHPGLLFLLSFSFLLANCFPHDLSFLPLGHLLSSLVLS